MNYKLKKKTNHTYSIKISTQKRSLHAHSILLKIRRRKIIISNIKVK